MHKIKEKIIYIFLWLIGFAAIAIIYFSNDTLHQFIHNIDDDKQMFYEKKVFIRRVNFDDKFDNTGVAEKIEQHKMVIIPKKETVIIKNESKPVKVTKPKNTSFEIKEIPH